jgi:ubiquinone/menaquinone biosynthesis C-methylase UbiE/uncharacterized protein YbaR (Trm112 family)
MRIFACPYCRTELKETNGSFRCSGCNRVFPVVEGIPDFLPKEASRERKRLVKFVDRLSSIYETPLWYPVVYHFYGGLFIPSVKRTVMIITDMLEIDGGTALDVACGTGLFTRNIASKAKQVYGFDISMVMLRRGRKYAERDNLENIVFARAEAENIPFPNEFFDGVSCCGALHLFPDVRTTLEEMNRVLKTDHKLAVMTFVRRRFLGIKRVYEHLEREHHAHIFNVDELQKYLENTGYNEFKYNIYGSMTLFEAKKISN